MPKLIHRFWAGKPMPREYVEYGELWRSFNPDYIVVDWDETCVAEFPALQPVFEDLYRRDAGRKGIELYVQLADVVAYALIERWGGVYVNCDMQPVRPLPDMPLGAWASLENDIGDIVNAAIGASMPGDIFWRGLLAELPLRYFRNPTAEMVQTTGPGLLTDWAREHKDHLHVFPVETFNPVHWKQISVGGDASSWIRNSTRLSPNTIAVHHWGHKKDGRSNCVETATQ